MNVRARVLIPHWKYYSGLLFAGALPVFVGVSISGAVTAFIDAIAHPPNENDDYNDVALIISLNFIYALFFGYFLGIIIVVNLSSIQALTGNANYINNIAIENCSFAWSATVSLIILKRIFTITRNNYGFAFGAWIVTVFLILCIIYITAFLRHSLRKDKTNEEEIERLIEFDSGIFSLAIAFGLTIIIAAGIVSNESTNYLTGVDDISSVDDSSGSMDTYDVLYIIYVIGVTVIVGLFEYCDKPIMTAIPTMLQTFRHRLSSVGSVEINSTIQPDPLFNYHSNGDERSLSANSCRFGEMTSDQSLTSFTDSFLFGWDSSNQLKRTYYRLFAAFRAYLVGCAWYSWSILSFQNYFSFVASGSLIGLFLYASFVTYVVLWMFAAWIDVDTENKNQKRTKDGEGSPGIEKERVVSKHIEHFIDESSSDKCSFVQEKRDQYRSEVLLLSGRLVVGWAWQQLVSSAVSSSVPVSLSNRLWLTAVTKCIVSFVITILGGYIDFKSRANDRPTAQDQAFDPVVLGQSPSDTDLQSQRNNSKKESNFQPADTLTSPLLE